MADLKTKPTGQSVDEFLDAIEDERKRADARVIDSIMREATGDDPKMWGPSIVGYGTYHYKYASGREGDWMLTGFSPRARNLTLYIMSGFGGYEETLAKLGKYKTGKACLYVNKLADVDLDVLRELVERSVRQKAEGESRVRS